MRFLFIIGTIVVLACSIWVSFNHTLELFMEGGYKNGLEWGITIAAETAFLMGVLSRFNSRLKGTKPHWSATFMFLLGLAVVGWSNWNAGAAYGVQGIIKGILVPFFIYGAEAVLAHEYMEWRKRKKKSNGENIQQDMSNDNNIQSESSLGIIQHIMSRVNNIQPMVSSQLDKSSENNIQPDTSSQWINQLDNSNTSTSSGVASSNENIQMDKPSENIQQSTSSDEKIQLEESGENIQQNTSSEENIQSHKSNENIQQKTSNDENVQLDNKNKKSNVVDLRSRKKRKNTDEEFQRVKELALRYEQENGELPGRPTLKEMAGCSEYIAKKVLDELKQTS